MGVAPLPQILNVLDSVFDDVSIRSYGAPHRDWLAQFSNCHQRRKQL